MHLSSFEISLSGGCHLPALIHHMSYLRLSLAHSDQRLISLNSSPMRIKLPFMETLKKLSLLNAPKLLWNKLEGWMLFPRSDTWSLCKFYIWQITIEGIRWEWFSLSHAIFCKWYYCQVIAITLTTPSHAKSLMPSSCKMNMVIICLSHILTANMLNYWGINSITRCFYVNQDPSLNKFQAWICDLVWPLDKIMWWYAYHKPFVPVTTTDHAKSSVLSMFGPFVSPHLWLGSELEGTSEYCPNRGSTTLRVSY